MERDDLETVKSLRGSTWLKNQVDEAGKGQAASLLRFVFEQSEKDHKKTTHTQNIQELLNARPHIAQIAALYGLLDARTRSSRHFRSRIEAGCQQ